MSSTFRTEGRSRTLLRIGVAGVWLQQAVWAKLLRRDARHEEIVRRAVGARLARMGLVAIAAGEMALAAWIASGRRAWAAAGAQTLALGVMNAVGIRVASDVVGRPSRLIARNAAFLGLAWVLAGLEARRGARQ